MRLRLTSTEEILEETKAEDIASDILIGRNADCQWRVPVQYGRIGRLHAKLVREGNKLFIQDCGSQNGTFAGDRRVRREEVVPGSTFILAQSLTLAADADFPDVVPIPQGAASRPAKMAQLVGWSRAERGNKIDIVSTPLLIGSAADAVLPVPDPLVSKRHAMIVREEDGGYAIRDLGSTNGTFVNEHRLAKEELRPLHHGDRLFIAHHGFFFDDGRGIHFERQAWVVGVSVAVSIVLIAVGYRFSGYQGGREDSAEQLPGVVSEPSALDGLNRLADWPPPIEEVLARLDRACLNGNSPHRHDAEKARDALRSLGPVVSAFESALARLGALPTDDELFVIESASASNMPPLAVGVDLRIRRLSDDLTLRRQWIGSLARLIREARSAEQGGELVGCGQAWENADSLEKVLACDTAGMGLRDPDRTLPVGEYDRYVGAESFYGFCLQLKGEKSIRPLVTPFKTELKRTSIVYRPVDELVTLMDKSSRAGDLIQTGPLDDFVRKCRLWRENRNVWVKRFTEEAAAGDARRGLIAAGIALQLAAQPETLTVQVDGRQVSLKQLAAGLFDRVGTELPGGKE